MSNQLEQRPGAGRFAPSPTGDLHIGNLRTALASWLDCRSKGVDWLIRFEDLDQVVASTESAQRQLDQLACLGLAPDRPPIVQSDQLDRYHQAIAELVAQDRTFPCFCSRREIREAIAASASAPNGPDPARYPGTCSGLGAAARAERAQDRPPALRFRAAESLVSFDDEHYGPQQVVVDDFVIQRNDGVPAYNLVVVVDDESAGIDTVVRAADLLPSTARQIMVGAALGYRRPSFAHVPLVVNSDGERLSKRDRSITLDDLAADGVPADRVLALLAGSMRLAEQDSGSGKLADLIPIWQASPALNRMERWSNQWNGAELV